jgi:protein-disulfide isomerase
MLSVVFVLLATVGCRAQEPGGKGAISDPVLARRIEILVRAKFNIPAEYAVVLGPRAVSKLPGYDSLHVTVSRGTRTTPIDFLISTDNTSLARLETFDLTSIPAQKIPVDNRPIRGNPNAKVTVINFDDLECPYCARMHQQLFPQTLDRYKDKVRFIYKDDPLTEIHPWALHAAIDSNCLGDQNSSAYWGYVDYLHSHGQEVSGEDRNLQKSNEALDRIAREQGKIFSLDNGKLDACLQKQDEASVRTSMREAEALGVEGTPFLFIDGERINGALPAEQVWMVIDRALRAAGVEPPPPPSTAATTAPPLGR